MSALAGTAPGDATFKRSPVHVLSGAHLPTLLRTLARHGGCAPDRIASVALTLFVSLLREPLHVLEATRVASRVAAATFDRPPVIILGHWRSGTTYLHNLMSRDPRFCFPTIVDAVLPNEFFPSRLNDISRKLLIRNLPPVRQVDDVPLRADLPQEDEIALAALGVPSFFNCLYFPGRYGEIFRREVLFDGLHARDLARWRRGLKYYLGKIAALHPTKQLLLKNPAHSPRVTELKALFPSAKFIHIHRDPYEVFVSMRRMLHVTFSIVALQDYDAAAIDEEILALYPILMDRLRTGLDTVGSHSEVRFADLVAKPMETLERIYEELDLDGLEDARPAIAMFLAQGATTPRAGRPLDPKIASAIGAAGANRSWTWDTSDEARGRIVLSSSSRLCAAASVTSLDSRICLKCEAVFGKADADISGHSSLRRHDGDPVFRCAYLPFALNHKSCTRRTGSKT